MPAPGHITYKDPFTGKLGPRPADVAPLVLTPAQLAAFSTSSEGLATMASPVARNAVLLRLRGRFHHGMIAHLDEHNGLTTSCATDLARSSSGTVELSR
jgi:hypothetical protein